MRECVDGADWFWDYRGDLQVRVCPMSDWRYETLLAIHEAVEAICCKYDGVTQESVDLFDTEYSKTHETDIEAGDDSNAPYKLQHTVACAVERVLAAHLRVDWKTYDTELEKVYPGKK